MNEKAPMLTAKNRERLGTRYNDRLRKSGGLPAVVYGRGERPVSISLDAKDALSHIMKGEKVFRLDLPNAKDGGQMVLLKDLQFDHMGTNVVHADFVRVSLTDRVRSLVPVHLIGEAKGLKLAGAILMHPTNEIEVECVVTDLPEFVEVDIAELDVGHAITARDVRLPSTNMRLLTDPHSIVAQIVIQQEIVVAEATTAEAAAAQPEVITAKKPEEEGAAPAAGDKKGAAPAAKGAAPAAKGAAPVAKGAAAPAAKGAAPAKDAKKG
ncbi:MAG: 50S ribosomal protein L25 [Phycisphaerae bacterium]|nr:50S ribosomal protein L25 [Phycisphaerae bacterium]